MNLKIAKACLTWSPHRRALGLEGPGAEVGTNSEV